MAGPNNLVGSIWNRWEPHIHAPGTVLNDKYIGVDPFEDFLQRVERSEPRIRALGITDYLSYEMYEKVVAAKKSGRLGDVELIFPNIEFRYSIGVPKGSALNAHLLVSPEGTDHIEQLQRFLNGLEFKVVKDVFRCNKEDLIRLGKKHDSKTTDDGIALQTGTNQFKVEFNHLVERINESEWAKKNILMAISGNEDGSAGLKDEASMAALRVELDRKAHIIFSANEKVREFWLGNGPASAEALQKKWDGRKPCIHGSDAHTNNDVGKPDLERYTWIKGDLTFESLRQICLEPAERVFIGPMSPSTGNSSKTITEFEISDAAWMETPTLEINPGLVAVI